MARQVTVYQVLIACPSDVESRGAVVREAIAHWNACHSRSRSVMLEPVWWRGNAVPSLTGEEAEAVIVDQIVRPSDILVGMFWTRHLADSQIALQRMWDALRVPGVLVVRTFDDANKLHYPPDEDLEFILTTTTQAAGSSDRYHGRRVYHECNRLLPAPERVEARFHVQTTVGMSESERLGHFEWVYSFRGRVVRARANRDGVPQADRGLADRVDAALARLKRRVQEDPDFFSLVGWNYAIACKTNG